jgi:hypothetical protein
MVVISFPMVKIRPLNFGISGRCPPVLLAIQGIGITNGITDGWTIHLSQEI